MQSSNVPWRPGTVPWLRGTISYQAPARARGRSAITGMAMLRVRSPRGSLAATASREFVGQQDLDIGGAVELPPGPLDDRA